MLMNCKKCSSLTPDYVNRGIVLELHQFKWLEGIVLSEICLEWNWLVGEYEHKDDVKNVHYKGGHGLKNTQGVIIHKIGLKI